MKVMLGLIVLFLTSCDTIRYRKGETGDKEAAINKKAEEFFKCFSTSKTVPEFSFTVARHKPSFSSGIKRFGVLNDPETIISSEGGDNACLERNLSGLEVPMLSLVDFEKVKFRWQRDKWKFLANDAYL